MAAFSLKSAIRESEAHRPVVPSVPAVGVVTRTLLEENRPALQPERIKAEGLVPGREDEALIMGERLLKEGDRMGESIWLFEFGI